MSGPGARGHWSDDETRALIQAWGPMYLGRNGGSLRVDDWRLVCDAVNAHRFNRSIAQCKWRLSNLKAQYKKELAKGQPTPGWRYFAELRAVLAAPYGGPPPVFAANMPPASVKEEGSDRASGSVGRKTGPAKRRFSSLQDILDRPAPGFPPKMPAIAKEEKEEVKEEEAGSEGPAHGAASAGAVVTKLAEVFWRVEMERLSVEKQKMAMKRAAN